MRLLNAKTQQFKLFENEDDFPRYAILSHTWETDQEVSYQDMMQDRSQLMKRNGYKKILKTAEKALKNDIHWIWVDTCCIDKTSSAELSEAINSMFKWYENSLECYVYLADVELPRMPNSEYDNEATRFKWFLQTKHSRWYTRGWTLQELVAPKYVQFFDKNWISIGTKNRHRDALHEITKIPHDVLSGEKPVGAKPIAQRMSWAAKRQTTRKEDMAYCLLGIMDSNMPLLYGEGGRRAFLRLQEQIINSSDDQSIFVWTAPTAGSSVWRGLLASSPAEFADCSRFKRILTSMDSDCQITNRGVRVTLPMVPLGDNVYNYPPPPPPRSPNSMAVQSPYGTSFTANSSPPMPPPPPPPPHPTNRSSTYPPFAKSSPPAIYPGVPPPPPPTRPPLEPASNVRSRRDSNLEPISSVRSRRNSNYSSKDKPLDKAWNEKPVALGLLGSDSTPLRTDIGSKIKALPLPNIVVPTNPNPASHEYLLYLNCKADSGGPRLAIRIMRLFGNQFVRVDCSRLYAVKRLNSQQRQAAMLRIVIPQSLGNRDWYRWNATRIGALAIEAIPQGAKLTDHQPLDAWDSTHEIWRFNDLVTQNVSCVLRLANGVNLSLIIHFDRSQPDYQSQLKLSLLPHIENRINVNPGDISGYIIKRGRLCWNPDVSCAVVYVTVLHRSGRESLSSQESADEDETDILDPNILNLTQSPRLEIRDAPGGSTYSSDSETATSQASSNRRRRRLERAQQQIRERGSRVEFI